MKICILLAVLFSANTVFACVDFSGMWRAVNPPSSGNYVRKIGIYQTACDAIEIDLFFSDDVEFYEFLTDGLWHSFINNQTSPKLHLIRKAVFQGGTLKTWHIYSFQDGKIESDEQGFTSINSDNLAWSMQRIDSSGQIYPFAQSFQKVP